VTTRPSCLPAARSAATRSRMKFEEVEDSGVLIKFCVNGSVRFCVDARSGLTFYHRQADGRNGERLGRGFDGGGVRRRRRHDVEVFLGDELTLHAQPEFIPTRCGKDQ